MRRQMFIFERATGAAAAAAGIQRRGRTDSSGSYRVIVTTASAAAIVGIVAVRAAERCEPVHGGQRRFHRQVGGFWFLRVCMCVIVCDCV